LDPFRVTADPAAYLPREATESALARLEDGLRRGCRVLVLSGPPGQGKTLLLHVLARRLERAFRSLYLPYASLDWRDLCAWVLGLLGEPAGAFPDRELLGSARHSAQAGRPLLLLVDEASSIPLETAERLEALVREAAGAVRLVLVPVDEARAGRVLGVLARDVEELRLSAPLTLDETERYLRTRLVRSGAPLELQRRFDAETVARIHAVAAGNPRRLLDLAGEVARGNEAALARHEALALGAPPPVEHALELDEAGGALDAPEAPDADLPAPAVAARGPAPPRATPAPARAPAPAARPAPPSHAALAGPTGRPGPLGPPEPETTNWWFVVTVNLAILGAMLAALWYAGFVPPP
jgi:type II secretory pathway predicted ATPase ExeA